MYKLTALLSLLLLVMLPFAGKAQTDSASYYQLMKTMSKEARIPYYYRKHGQPTEMTMVYTVSKGKKTVLYFPEDTPDSLRQGFRNCEKALLETNWAKLFPQLCAKGDFSIVVPVIITFDDYLTKRTRDTADVARLLDFYNKVEPPYKIVDVISIVAFRGIQ